MTDLTQSPLVALHRAVALGTFPLQVLEESIQSGDWLPECEILDFKQEVPASDSDYVKAMRDAVALHNSHGGFMLFGIAEVERDKKFEVLGIGNGAIHAQKIKDLVRSYCGTDIRLNVRTQEISGAKVEIVHIAKRTLGEPPVRFLKNGPETKPGIVSFKKNDVVFRRIDSNAIASNPDDYDFLYSERKPPSLNIPAPPIEASEPLWHNLPDRTLICSRFVGRASSLGDLWVWLADDFLRVKLIAGEGGLGKTSLAYRFSEELASRRVKPYTNVLWLSAKKKQFIPALDTYREYGHVDYESAESLFRVICIELGCLETDFQDLESRELMQLALETCATVPAFIVVDDVDSLTPDDQKSVMEFALRVPKTAKALLTTRVNFSYAPENVLKLDGLAGEEYVDFVRVLRAKYQLTEATPKQIDRLRDATGGSPLFSDSLLRLEKRGLTLEAAIEQWKGEKGVEARKAALQREVQQLSKHAKRVLYVTSLLRNCSYTELAQIVEYSDETLGDALQELASLFLISAPAIAKEARYAVEPNTGALVLEIASSLAIDHTSLQTSTKRARTDAVGISLNKRMDLVGQAINQALAKMKAGDPKGALHGVLDVAKKLSKPHPDLLLMIGRCQLTQAPPNFAEAAKALEQSYTLGQRKALLFDFWFQAEFGRGDLEAALTMVDIALEQPTLDLKDWHERRAQIRIERARLRNGGGSDFLRRELDEAIVDLKAAARYAAGANEIDRLGRLISQAKAFKAAFFRRQTSLTAQGLSSLEELYSLASGNPGEPDLLMHYLEAVAFVLSAALTKYVGKPKGKEREILEKHMRAAKSLGSDVNKNNGLPYKARESFHRLSTLIDQYLQRRDI